MPQLLEPFSVQYQGVMRFAVHFDHGGDDRPELGCPPDVKASLSRIQIRERQQFPFQPLVRLTPVREVDPRENVNRLNAAFVCLLALTVWGVAFASPAHAEGKITMEGHAWRAYFGDGVQIDRGGGATIYIAEHPELTTTAAADGYWTLEVPDRESITPCAELPGHHPTCDQTFFTRGNNLNQINFQMVDDTIAGVLAAFSGAETEIQDGAARLKNCTIVSTFFERDKRSFLDFQEFLDRSPHGVAGATAVAVNESGQEVPGPIYYNESVLPDNSLTASSRDGGVMWANLTPGVYTISSSHPTTRFSTFRATCRQGRLINASPPWGLYEMARNEEPNPAVLAPDPEPLVPLPIADRSVDGHVLSATTTRSRSGRFLKVIVKANEKLKVKVVARQGKTKVTRRTRVGAGRSKVFLRLPKKLRARSIKARTVLSDTAGNQSASVARLALSRIATKNK